jgi:hypothetical protein
MKKKTYIILFILFLGLFLIIITNFIFSQKTNNKTKGSQFNGISTTIEKNTTKADIEISLDKMQNINSSIALCVMEYINDSKDSKVKSITDWNVKMDTFMDIANEKNIKVQMLKPHIGTYTNGDNFSRAEFNPKNKDLFFKNWESILLRYAKYCNKYDIPILAIECEMSQLTTANYYSNWKQIIDDIKTKYPHLKITTALKHSDLEREINFKQKGSKSILDLTDYIGYNFYPVLLRNSPRIIKDNQIDTAHKIWNKKILITETGGTSWSNIDSSKIYPVYIPKNKNMHYDFIDQHAVLNSVLNYTLNNKNIVGIFLWHTNKPFNFLDNDDNYNLVKKYYGTKL